VSLAKPSADRFLALDSMRGVFACLVALYHLHTTSWLGNLPLIRGGWLFVDFFFVLSGFVIASAYRKRLAEGFGIGNFMWLRMGRVYPLHIFMLALFLIGEIVAMSASGGVTQRVLFADGKSIEALLGSVFLVQIFGIWPYLVWNGPSWSIAAEVWTYLLFAVLARFARWFDPILIAAALASGAALLFTGDGGLDRTFDFSLVRCIFSFSLGALTHSAYALATARGSRWGARTGSLLELTAAGATLVFVWLRPGGVTTLLAPLFFIACVLVFAHAKGFLSALLATAPFRMLGLLSYSIYMTHAFVISRMLDVFHFAGRRLGIETVAIDGSRKTLAIAGAGGEIATVAVLLAVVAMSLGTYYLVERPCREWSRRRLAAGGKGQVELRERVDPTF
jgi:peptidoglycan/LPS O-acetylase OafA/YrhL